MFKKIILSFLFVFSIIFCLMPIDVFGVPEEKFLDLSKNNIYYEDVMYFINNGVINGREDGLFYPEEFISTAEAVTIIEKTIGKDENLPDNWSWWKDPVYNNNYIKGWTPDWYFPLILIKGDYMEAASRNTIACLLLNTVEAPIVKPEVWGLDSYRESENSIYFLNLVLRGYWEENDQSYVGVSRAEFCNLLRWFMENYQDLPEPKEKIYVSIQQKYIGDISEKQKIQDYYRVYYSISLLPKNVQKYFTEKGYRFYIVDDKYWEQYFSDIDYAAGVFFDSNDRKNKSIYIRELDSRTVFHEFGHFLDEMFWRHINKVRKIYDKDEWSLVSLSNSLYTRTSVKEYFADGFAMYLLNRVELEEKLPELTIVYQDILNELDKKYQN